MHACCGTPGKDGSCKALVLGMAGRLQACWYLQDQCSAMCVSHCTASGSVELGLLCSLVTKLVKFKSQENGSLALQTIA